ncbi:HupE/UreJ family protein [Mangrovimonas sp. YM274]|uniref:HupE/UreJ family protein n=1 Tax=Mangrovimonas sp. YM274 TaxID=3070660 RepID=UPI0027DD26CF|nr:HupE/UreJ family protein [Mangrovimonas sp. YM274]WMI68669.1 HupE/UreJ family protein [Mangrovimonas sp. YM274]
MLADFLTHLQQGMYHVLNIKAYDHILFLIVLLVPFAFKDWKRVLFLITLFTLGHSLSLALAIYDVIRIKGSLVDFLILCTILIIALYNVFTSGKKAQNEKIGVLFFATLFLGLVHGMGYVGIFGRVVHAADMKLVTLLELSLGLEMGQLIIAFIILFLGFLGETIFRFSKRDWVMVVSAMVLGGLVPVLMHSGYLF